MKIIITGAAGFLGQRLAQALLTNAAAPKFDELLLVDQVPANQPIQDQRVHCQVVDLAAPGAVEALFYRQTDLIFHLAAVVSSHAEADFELGNKINFDVTRSILETTRSHQHTTKFVFSSSIAVFGGNLPEIVTDLTSVTPQSSYGCQKAMCELLINEYSRKGYIDGRILRLPTIVVRPGAPNQAASSFSSGIIREPLNGKEALCPVGPELELWLSSPSCVVDNLIHAANLPASTFGCSRIVNLPGITVSVGEMVEALGTIAGTEVTNLIRFEKKPQIEKIVSSWPSRLVTERALKMGFHADKHIHDLINNFIHQDLQGAN